MKSRYLTREILSGPRRKLGRLPARYSVGERNLAVGIRTQVGMRLEVTERTCDPNKAGFFGAVDQANGRTPILHRRAGTALPNRPTRIVPLELRTLFSLLFTSRI
jgi:hypothetical protein